MTPRQVVPLVKYEGTDISEDIAPHLKSISFTDNMSGYADDLTSPSGLKTETVCGNQTGSQTAGRRLMCPMSR